MKKNLLISLLALLALQPLSAMDHVCTNPGQLGTGHPEDTRRTPGAVQTESRQEELDDALFEAVSDKDLDHVKKLLHEGANVNDRDDVDNTPLIHACKYLGGLESISENIIELLLEAHAEVNAQNDSGGTALLIAAELKRDGICSLLLKNNANVNLYTKNGHTALTAAAQWGTEFTCQELLKAGASQFPTPIKTNYTLTALIYAAKKNRTPICQLMVNHQRLCDNGIILALLYFKNHANDRMRVLYREKLLKPYLENYTLKALLNAEEKQGERATGRTAHHYLQIDCLKPISTGKGKDL